MVAAEKPGGGHGDSHGHGPGPGITSGRKRGEGRGTCVPGARQPRGDARHDAPAALYLTSRDFSPGDTQTCANSRICASPSRNPPRRRNYGALPAGRGERSGPDATAARLRLVAAYTRGVAYREVEPEPRRTPPRGDTSAPRSPPRQREQELLDLFGRRDESAADAQPSVVPVHPRAGGGCRGTPRRGRRRNAARRRFRVGVGGGVSWCTRRPRSTVPSTRWRIVRVSRRVSLARVRSKPRGAQTLFVQYEERDITGAAGLQKVGEWLDSGACADGAHGFPLPEPHRTVLLRVLTATTHTVGAARCFDSFPPSSPQARHAHVNVAPSRRRST